MGVAAIQVVGNGNNCPKDEIDRCVKIAEPLLKNPTFVFPSNREDMTIVCK